MSSKQQLKTDSCSAKLQAAVAVRKQQECVRLLFAQHNRYNASGDESDLSVVRIQGKHTYKQTQAPASFVQKGRSSPLNAVI